MKRILMIMSLMLTISAEAATLDVFVYGNRFDPEVVTIQPGDTVRWQVVEGSHQLIPEQPELVPGFNSGLLSRQQTYRYQFDQLTETLTYRSSAIEAIRAAVDPQPQPNSFDFDKRLSAGWYNRQTDGQGLLFDYVPSVNLMTAYWFTFDPVSGEQMWLFASGVPVNNRVTMSVLRPVGGRFDQPQTVTRPDWGEITVDFTDCSNAMAWYDGSVDGLSGQFPLTRLYLASLCQ